MMHDSVGGWEQAVLRVPKLFTSLLHVARSRRTEGRNIRIAQMLQDNILSRRLSYSADVDEIAPL